MPTFQTAMRKAKASPTCVRKLQKCGWVRGAAIHVCKMRNANGIGPWFKKGAKAHIKRCERHGR